MMFIGSATLLSAFMTGTSLYIVISFAIAGLNILTYLLELLVAVASGAFFLPIFKLFIYHL